MSHFFQQLSYWHWIGLGSILLMSELVTTSGFAFWSGMSAACVGFLVWFYPDLPAIAQVLAFFFLSAVAIALWSYYLRRNPLESDQPTQQYNAQPHVGNAFTLQVPIVNGLGKIRTGDSIWRVKCHMDLPIGARIKIVDIDDVVLIAVPIELS